MRSTTSRISYTSRIAIAIAATGLMSSFVAGCVVREGRPNHGGSNTPPPPPPPPGGEVTPGPGAPPPPPGGGTPALGTPPSADPTPPAPEPDDPVLTTPPRPIPPQPPVSEPPEARTPPAQLPGGVGMGRPKAFKADAGTAFWIWHNANGTWRVRSTAAGNQTFGGRAVALSGKIGGVRPTRTEFVDRVIRKDTHLYFKYASTGGIDGLDFNTQPDSCVRFQLSIGAGGAEGRIFVGENAVQPPSAHFIVCPR
jgi:hypothetical protein